MVYEDYGAGILYGPSSRLEHINRSMNGNHQIKNNSKPTCADKWILDDSAIRSSVGSENICRMQVGFDDNFVNYT